MRKLLFLLAALLALAVARAGTTVQFRTVLGDLKVELYDTEKPVTVTNFLQYVADGAYNDDFFHRVVPDFVIQGGGFGVTNKGTTNANIVQVKTRAPIINEYASGPHLPNLPGTLAMAKTADPNSATSQFFFNFKTNTALDSVDNSGGFTVFGRVVSGWETLTNWNSFTYKKPPATNIVVNVGSAPFGELPVLVVRTNSVGGPYIDLGDLLLVDITLLDVHVRRLDTGAAEIQWSLLADRINTVEYTTEFPPQWQVLTNFPASESGPGLVVDPTPDPKRFYRVRATY